MSACREEDQARKALAISMLQWPADILKQTLSEGCTSQQQHHAEDQHLFLFKRCVLSFIAYMCQSVFTHACSVHRSQKKTPYILLWNSKQLSHLIRYCHQIWVLLPLSHLSKPLNHSQNIHRQKEKEKKQTEIIVVNWMLSVQQNQ